MVLWYTGIFLIGHRRPKDDPGEDWCLDTSCHSTAATNGLPPSPGSIRRVSGGMPVE